MSDEDDTHHRFHAFPIPPELAEKFASDHDRMHLEHEHRRMAAFNLVDILPPDQLLVVGQMLQLDKDSRRFLVGMIGQQMRAVHHVDFITGDPLIPEMTVPITIEQLGEAINRMVFQGDNQMFDQLVIPAIERKEIEVTVTEEGLRLRLVPGEQ